ncbi:hypothetical protein DBZ36_07700 [Alginatibacterium sediminis]|uniref:Beta-xylanase n=1 Tax=Alginatibacterium sediminis TaxID=2164068 RepID=A0A420EIC2_9ALTE|nr:endo-1,4-beta-xylanase [Alginatibacterium sediminis]RKF20316.1 hypothetical protein DBZ36_07700 [Alginatibacterium sediminis]
MVIYRKLIGVFFAIGFSGSISAQELPHLRQYEADTRVLLGAALESKHLEDAQFASSLQQHFGQLSFENELKWESVHPEPDRFDFSGPDKIVEFAQANQMELRGHTLVWHIQNPEWLLDAQWTRDSLLLALEQHIHSVVGRYKGKIKYWDVVNEAFDDQGGYRDTIWYQVIGPDYISKAFQYAHAADPEALLFYNDYSTEGMSPKANAVYRLVNELLDQGVPIHGVGTQAHFDGRYPLSRGPMAKNIERFRELGLTFHFTEVDVRIADSAGVSALDKQAEIYQELIEFALHYDNIDVMTMWGVSDKYSWIPSWFKGQGRALILDENFQSKPAFDAIAEQLDSFVNGQFSFRETQTDANAPRYFHPFVANRLSSEMQLDGKLEKWGNARFYPFAYNQLGGVKQVPGLDDDLSGRWAISYFGNRIYGRVERRDDLDFSRARSDMHENDQIEVFVQLKQQFYQLRALLEQDFAKHAFPGRAHGQWFDDNRVFEFEIVVQDLEELAGENIGFSIALSDLDQAGGSRHLQLYPVPGKNMGWQGEGFAELYFPAQNRELSSTINARPMTFIASELTQSPSIDKHKRSLWREANLYPLGFNLSHRYDQSLNAVDLRARWQLAHKDNRLFLSVLQEKLDPSLYLKDSTIVLAWSDGNQVQSRELAFSDQVLEIELGHGRWLKGQWSDDASRLEAQLVLADNETLPSQIPWNIELRHKNWRLSPVTGEAQSLITDNLSLLSLM